MELVDIVVAILVGIGVGFGMIATYVWFFLYRPIKSRVDRMIAAIAREAEENLIGLTIEVDQGVYFCYNHEDRQFICQGATVADIRRAFGERYPNKTAYLAGGDPEVVAEFRAELIKLSANENSLSQ